MPDIPLLPIDASLVDGVALGPTEFTGRYGAELAEHAELVGDVVRQTLEMPAAPAPWCGYLTVDAATRAVIGTRAFVGPPSDEGAVEIASFTFPAFEGRGYATAMAERLVRAAWGQPQVRYAAASTLCAVAAATPSRALKARCAIRPWSEPPCATAPARAGSSGGIASATRVAEIGLSRAVPGRYPCSLGVRASVSRHLRSIR